LLARLFDALLEKPGARIDRADVQAALETLKAFYVEDARRLRHARERVGRGCAFVPQAERDALFIEARAAESPAVRGAPRPVTFDDAGP